VRADLAMFVGLSMFILTVNPWRSACIVWHIQIVAPITMLCLLLYRAMPVVMPGSRGQAQDIYEGDLKPAVLTLIEAHLFGRS
jgi:hypothetical protein